MNRPNNIPFRAAWLEAGPGMEAPLDRDCRLSALAVRARIRPAHRGGRSSCRVSGAERATRAARRRIDRRRPADALRPILFPRSERLRLRDRRGGTPTGKANSSSTRAGGIPQGYSARQRPSERARRISPSAGTLARAPQTWRCWHGSSATCPNSGEKPAPRRPAPVLSGRIQRFAPPPSVSCSAIAVDPPCEVPYDFAPGNTGAVGEDAETGGTIDSPG